jgi:hypothetical protein
MPAKIAMVLKSCDGDVPKFSLEMMVASVRVVGLKATENRLRL